MIISCDVVGVHEIDRARPDQFFGCVSENRLDRRRDPREPVLEAADRDDVRAVLRESGGAATRVDELADVVRHHRDDIVFERNRDHAAPGFSARREVNLLVVLDPFAGSERRFEQSVDRAAVQLVAVRGDEIAGERVQVRHPAPVDELVGVQDPEVEVAVVVADSTERDEADVGALECSARELSQI